MIKELLLKKLLEAGFDAAKHALKRASGVVQTTAEDLELAIGHHLRFVRNWSGEISFTDLKVAKRTTDVFIDLSLWVSPRRIRMNSTEVIESVPLQSLLDNRNSHIVLLGQPGAGKTTSMKRLCQLLLGEDD